MEDWAEHVVDWLFCMCMVSTSAIDVTDCLLHAVVLFSDSSGCWAAGAQ